MRGVKDPALEGLGPYQRHTAARKREGRAQGALGGRLERARARWSAVATRRHVSRATRQGVPVGPMCGGSRGGTHVQRSTLRSPLQILRRPCLATRPDPPSERTGDRVTPSTPTTRGNRADPDADRRPCPCVGDRPPRSGPCLRRSPCRRRPHRPDRPARMRPMGRVLDRVRGPCTMRRTPCRVPRGAHETSIPGRPLAPRARLLPTHHARSSFRCQHASSCPRGSHRR